jgi:hypothetical protein
VCKEVIASYISIYGPTAPYWALAAFSVSWSFTQMVGLLGRGISPSQGRYLHKEQCKHRINAYIDIHALSGIRPHDRSLRSRGHCDQHFTFYLTRISRISTLEAKNLNLFYALKTINSVTLGQSSLSVCPTRSSSPVAELAPKVAQIADCWSWTINWWTNIYFSDISCCRRNEYGNSDRRKTYNRSSLWLPEWL